MTQDEIIEMARQADAYADAMDIGGKNYIGLRDEYFAKLVALHYEKKIADLENIISQRHWDVLQEREACAKVCEEEGKLWSKAGCTDTQTFGLCATVIRARGEA